MATVDKRIRDHVEETIINRLLRTEEDDREVNEHYFESLIQGLESTMCRVADKYFVSGFTREDLMGFMYLKTHQMLRRSQLNTTRLPHSVFYTAYTNLMHDILRMQKRAGKNGMREDPLDVLNNKWKGLDADNVGLENSHMYVSWEAVIEEYQEFDFAIE